MLGRKASFLFLVRSARLRAVCAVLLAVIATATAAQPVYTPYVFSTLAGSAGSGTADGVGPAAEFNEPSAVAVARDGTVFVADTNNHAIRRVTLAGEVSTFAGVAGQPGNADGAGASARFNRPMGIAIDAQGTLFVADTGNHTIRAISPGGGVSTVAGLAGIVGRVDAFRANARFSGPRGLSLDGQGNLYIADTFNYSIRKLTPGGEVSTVAGANDTPAAPPAIAFRFAFPTDVAADHAGNLFVADNGAVRKISPPGAIETVVASFAGRIEFQAESRLAIDGAGNLYQSARHAIRVLARDGNVADFAGSGTSSGATDGLRADARFSRPRGLAADAAGNLFVADTGNNTLRHITAAGTVVTLAGRAGTAGDVDDVGRAARFNFPWGLALDARRRVFVADQGNGSIRKIEPDGAVSTFAGTPHRSGSADGPPGVAQFGTHGPYGIAVDPAGNVFVCDADNFTVRKITPAGVVTTFAGRVGEAGAMDGRGDVARFMRPVGIASDAAGTLYVTDNGAHTIRKITPAGDVTTIAGGAGVAGMRDGHATEARFNRPVGIAVDHAGNILVADQQNHVVRKISAAGSVSTLAGSAGVPGNADGTGEAAQFWGPSGVAVDGRGNVFVTDTVNSTVRRITLAGVVTTLGGVPREPGSAEGAGEYARFNAPVGIAAGDDGAILVADAINNVIRVGRPAGAPVSTARLANISARAVIQPGNGVAVVGFAIAAPAGATKRLLLRVVGPGLRNLGVTDALPRPRLTLHDSAGRVIGTGGAWGEPPGAGEAGSSGTIRAASAAEMQAVGAFALAGSSQDAAVSADLPPGTYTLVASTRDAVAGTALAEVYETDAAEGVVLRNISSRVQVSAGSGVAIAGFVVTGQEPATLLVRGIGPALAAFGVTDALPRLSLTIFDAAGRMIAHNVAWNDRIAPGDSAVTFALAPATAAGAQRVGAFPLAGGASDAALQITLPAGNYTAVLSGEGAPLATGLLEVYLDP